jgi:hypothetical protein
MASRRTQRVGPFGEVRTGVVVLVLRRLSAVAPAGGALISAGRSRRVASCRGHRSVHRRRADIQPPVQAQPHRRLEEQVTEGRFRDLALGLKGARLRLYERPSSAIPAGMRVGSGAWAFRISSPTERHPFSGLSAEGNVSVTSASAAPSSGRVLRRLLAMDWRRLAVQPGAGRRTRRGPP